MVRLYKYFHITVNPKNCDGTDRIDNYLIPKLITELDSNLISLSAQYARAIEQNRDKYGKHYHFVMFSTEKYEEKNIKTKILDILQNHYALTEQGQNMSVKIKHKTLNQANLCAGGYLTKSFKKGFAKNELYITNIDDEKIKSYREEYETILSESAKGKFSKWVLYEEKDKTWIRTINEYCRAIDIIRNFEDTELIQFNSSNFQKYYIHILQKYKIGFEYNNIKKFHRQIIEYLIMDNNSTETDNETLVHFIKFQKEEIININYTSNGYQPEGILKYWSIQ